VGSSPIASTKDSLMSAWIAKKRRRLTIQPVNHLSTRTERVELSPACAAVTPMPERFKTFQALQRNFGRASPFRNRDTRSERDTTGSSDFSGNSELLRVSSEPRHHPRWVMI
jgi:hypothetical protein